MSIPPINFEFPEKMTPIVTQRARNKVAKGGRGSTKSWTFARLSASRAATERIKIVCAREFQKSIKDSVHALIKNQIYMLGLSKCFRITQDSIVSSTGSEFIFKGMHGNLTELKSMEGIDIFWGEEAEKFSKDSWDVVIPTIRKEGSEIWVSYNPETPQSPTHQYFVAKPRPDSIIVDINYWDNPWFPDVLRREMEYDKATDPEKWGHVWAGKFKRYADDLVFKGKFSMERYDTPVGVQFFYGMDFGFSVDPTVLNRMWIKKVDHALVDTPAMKACPKGCRRPHAWLMIDHEAYGHGVELSDLEAFVDTVPGVRKGWEIRADSARPDTISFLNQKGFNIVGAEKGAGSVEDGIQFIRGFDRVVFHTRCPQSYGDWSNYRMKRDKITGGILPIPLDLSNHSPDATRYALEDYIKSQNAMWDILGG